MKPPTRPKSPRDPRAPDQRERRGPPRPPSGAGPRPNAPNSAAHPPPAGPRGPSAGPGTSAAPRTAFAGPRSAAAGPRAPGAGPKSPPGTVWLYGHHAVAAALANPQRRLRRLLLTAEAEAAIAAEQPQPWPLAPELTERTRLDGVLGRDAVHQGAALLADPLATPPLATCLERGGPVLVLDQVSDPRNVGAIMRSAAAFGVACVIAQERNAPEETGALAKAASGALETVPLLRAVNIVRTLAALRASGLWIVGLDAAGSALAGPSFAERRVALVLGAEGPGLRRLTRESCDELAGLGMRGAMESLNVSVAAGIALYELTRAR